MKQQSIDQDRRAYKRVQIGLAPERPTAKMTPQRPPEQEDPRLNLGLITLLFSALIIVTVLLIIAKISDSPTSWPQVQENVRAWWQGDSAQNVVLNQRVDGKGLADHEVRSVADANAIGAKSTDPHSQSILSTARDPFIIDDFSQPGLPLAKEELPGERIMWLIPDQGIYRIRVWPGQAAWTILNAPKPNYYRLEVGAIVPAETPSGSAGLISRHQDNQNFYLYLVNGQQQFQILLQSESMWYTVQPLTFSEVLNPAGRANVIALEDDGKTLRLFANDVALHTIESAQLPHGDAGLAGVAQTDDVAEVNFDWLKFYRMPE